MTETDGWLKLYEDTHQDLTYPAVFWAAVPMVVLGTVGVLWTLPIPDEFFEISPLLNWGTAFLMASECCPLSWALQASRFGSPSRIFRRCAYRSACWSWVSLGSGWGTAMRVICAPYYKIFNS